MITANLTTIIAGLLLLCSSGLAKDIYVAQNARGNGNGTDCANARVYTWFNTAGNWGAGPDKISPGDTVHICGTITTSAGKGLFQFQGSGTSGNPITLKFETNAILQAPYFGGSVNSAIWAGSYSSTVSYRIVDGGTNGIIQNTDNGSTLTYQNSTVGIDASNCSNCEFKNLTIRNLYLHSQLSDMPSNLNAACIYWNGTGGTQTNISVHDNTFHDAFWCLSLSFGVGNSNLSFYNNRIYNVDHGIALGASGNSDSLAHVNIYNNHIGDYANWDTTWNATTGCLYHHDGIHIFAFGTANASDVNIYNNLFDGDPGTGGCANAHIYIEANSQNMNIFNNLFTSASTGPYLFAYTNVGNAGVTTDRDSVYNNTYLGGGFDNSGVCAIFRAATNLSIKNNVFTGCQTFAVAYQPTCTLATGGLNNNVYAKTGRWYWNTDWQTTLAGWKAATGQDGNALAVPDALLNSDGTVQASSPIIGVGANLTYLGVSALNFDRVGKPRPADRPWTPSAYCVGPAPPTGLTPAPQ